MRSFATSVSSRPSPTATAPTWAGSTARPAPNPRGCGRKIAGGEREHQPVPRRHRPLQEREIAAGVLEQRPFVDHRQLEVGVGIVDRLPAGLGDDDEQERQQREGLGGVAPDARARAGGGHSAQVGGRAGQRGAREGEHERGLHGHADGEVAARALQREPVPGVPGRRRQREAREREQAEQDERVVPDRPAGRVPGDRHEQARQREHGSDDRGCEAVDRARTLGIHDRLAPQPRELAIGLQRRCAAAALQARLRPLRHAGQERREQNDAAHLDGPCEGVPPGHPSSPRRASARSATSRPARYSA